MSKKLGLLLTLLTTLSAASNARAAETDNYVAWGRELPDATNVLNGYLNDQIQIALKNVNREETQLGCHAVTLKVIKQLVGFSWVIDISKWAKHSPDVSRLYADSRAEGQGTPPGIYSIPQWPIGGPKLSPTIRVNDVNMGTDKIGHVFMVGGDYYKQSFEAMASGLTEEQALRKVYDTGVFTEVWTLGYMLGGVFSYADLEANYQGMLLYRRMCGGGENSYLVHKPTGWEQREQVDLRDYVNPAFDETFNRSFYAQYKWGKIKRVLKKHYCPMLALPAVRERFASYRERLVVKSPSQIYFEAWEKTKQGSHWDRSRQSVEKVCDVAAGVAGG